MKQPKFKIGDTVTHSPDLKGGTLSEVYEVTRKFWSGDPNELAYLETNLPHMNSDIKWEIIDNSLVIHPYKSSMRPHDSDSVVEYMTSRKEIPFYGYSYSVRNSGMNTLYPEKSLTLVKLVS